MIWIYWIIAFIISSFCFHKANKCYEEEYELLWAFAWEITGIGIIISMFRL